MKRFLQYILQLFLSMHDYCIRVIHTMWLPSKHYTYQAKHIKILWGISRITQTIQTTTDTLATPLPRVAWTASGKCPSSSLRHLLIQCLADQELLCPNSLPMSCYLMGYVLCAHVQQRTHTNVHTIYHCSWQLKKASFPLLLQAVKKQIHLNMGQKSTLVLWTQPSAQLR